MRAYADVIATEISKGLQEWKQEYDSWLQDTGDVSNKQEDNSASSLPPPPLPPSLFSHTAIPPSNALVLLDTNQALPYMYKNKVDWVTETLNVAELTYAPWIWDWINYSVDNLRWAYWSGTPPSRRSLETGRYSATKKFNIVVHEQVHN